MVKLQYRYSQMQGRMRAVEAIVLAAAVERVLQIEAAHKAHTDELNAKIAAVETIRSDRAALPTVDVMPSVFDRDAMKKYNDLQVESRTKDVRIRKLEADIELSKEMLIELNNDLVDARVQAEVNSADPAGSLNLEAIASRTRSKRH